MHICILNKVLQLHPNSILLQEWQIQARQGKSAVTFITQLLPAARGFRDMHFCLMRIFITWRWPSHSTFQSFEEPTLVAQGNHKASWFLNDRYCKPGDICQAQKEHVPRSQRILKDLIFLFFSPSQERRSHFSAPLKMQHCTENWSNVLSQRIHSL